LVDGQLPRFDASSNLVESQQMAIDLMADTHVQVEDPPRLHKAGLLGVISHSTPSQRWTWHLDNTHPQINQFLYFPNDASVSVSDGTAGGIPSALVLIVTRQAKMCVCKPVGN
jgi:hypothetical protein